jgi:hypothetical protein
VLYVDGEMSRRLCKDQLASAVARTGLVPDQLYPLNHEDIDNFAPLNTEAGQKFIDDYIAERGGVSLVIFDNIMSLVSGDQKDEESWRPVLPWFRSLTQRGIAQIWIHHTGHDTEHSYGTKTREWQMDTVMHLVRKDEPDDSENIKFTLVFKKAREKRPQTRADFRDTKITLANGAWTTEPVMVAKKGRPATARIDFNDAFTEALDSHGVERRVRSTGPLVRAVKVDDVRDEFCRRHVTGEDTEDMADATQKATFRRLLKEAKNNGYATERELKIEWIWKVKP